MIRQIDGKRELSLADEWRSSLVYPVEFTGQNIFEGRIVLRDGFLLPTITGTAFITAESTLILDPRDAFCWGIPA